MRTILAIVVAMLVCVSRGLVQNRDAQAAADMNAVEAELLKTAASTCDRIEYPHLVAYFDKGLLAPDAERKFGQRLEEGFTEVARFLNLTFDPRERGTSKPDYYVTDRGGLSHAWPTRVILRAKRVMPSGLSIAYHETAHLLVMHDPSAPRNRGDLPPDEDARVWANSAFWLPDGFADYVSFEIARRLHVVPTDLFDEGKSQADVDAHARKWLIDPRGRAVLPYIASHGNPDNFLADRENVAAPYYVLGHSFVNFLVRRFRMATIVRLYDKQANGVGAIEDDFRSVTGADLASVRNDWLKRLGVERVSN